MLKTKRSFFEKITGGIRLEDDEYTDEPVDVSSRGEKGRGQSYASEDADEGQLSVDVYQTTTEIVIQTMVAGVRPARGAPVSGGIRCGTWTG